MRSETPIATVARFIHDNLAQDDRRWDAEFDMYKAQEHQRELGTKTTPRYRHTIARKEH